MKIGIDIQTTLGQKTGFGFYVSNLVRELKKVDRDNEYFLFRPKQDEDLSAPKRFLWDQVILPRKAKEAKVDILHQPAFSAPIFYRGKVVVTVHDIIAILFGEDIPFGSRLYFARWMPFSYRRADFIITVSQSTKNDLVSHLGIEEEKIKVIYEAPSETFFKKIPQKEIDKVKQKYQTGKNFLLHIGTLNPRKNLEFLVSVFAEITKTFPQYNLVITGKRGWYYESLFRLVKKLDLGKKVVFPGYVPDEDTPALYQGATIFLFPSLYEGFGLPPLEAMASGVPVVSSNTSSMPEVVAGAGVLLSPKDKSGWVEAIRGLLENKTLLRELQRKGKRQATLFSWQKTALETKKVYEDLSHHY